MTISTTESEIAYNGNGITTVFSFPYRFLANGDIVVVGVSSTGVSTTKVLTTDYTLTGAGDDAGGTVTMLVAPAVGTRLIIYRDTEIVQETDFISGDPFPAETHERALDRLTMIAQEIIPQSTRSIRVPVGDPVSLNPTLPAAVDRLDKFIVFDATTGATELSTVTQTQVASAVTAAYAAGTTADAITFLPEGVGAVSRSVQSKLRESVSVTDFGASTGATAAANVIAFQAALTKGGRVYVPAGTYDLNDELIASVVNTELILDKGAVLSWGALGPNKAGIKVTANHFSITGGQLQGPSAGVYVANENGIEMLGTSTTVRKTGLRLDGVEMMNFGSHGVYAQFVDQADVDRSYFHDCGYSGATFLSCDNGNFTRNTIDNITPGVSANMYGVSITHDSTGYAGGGKLAAHPFCRGWTVQHNEVSRIDWEGIDCHGGYEIDISHNRVYATRMGISAPNSSGDAGNYAGYQNTIAFNVVDGRNKDGSVSGYENLAYGINLNGGSVVNNQNILCIGNIVRYKGAVSNASSGAIQGAYCTGGLVSNNNISFWGGNGIYVGGSSIKVSDNYIGGMVSSGDAYGYCVNSDFGTNTHLTVTGNTHDASSGGSFANVGIWTVGLTNPVLYAAGNDFSKCTNLLGETTRNWVKGGQFAGNQITAVSGDTTPSVRALGTAANGILLIPATSTYTITDIDDAFDGQSVTIINTGTQNITIDRSKANLHGAANQVMLPKYSLTLTKFGNVWFQLAPMSTNG